MPALKPVPGVARVQALWDVGADDDVTTTTYWSYSGGSFTSGQAADMATEALGRIPDAWNDAYVDTVIFTGIRITDLASDTAGDGTATDTFAGIRSGAQLPADACAVSNYTIDRRYRGGKPRGFWPLGVASDLENDRTWTDDALETFLGFVQSWYAMINGISAGGTTIEDHVSIGRYSGFTVQTSPSTGRAKNVPTPLATPVVYNVISTAIAPRVGSQRRRLGR